jgi:NADH:ubiquinone oxidoreductase subunit
MLGAALQKMAEVDEVLFWGQWGRARGCLIEHEVAKKYKIPISYGTDWAEELTDKTRDDLNSDPNRWPKDKKAFENANQLDKKCKEYADNRKDVSPYSNLTKRCEEYERAQKEWADFCGSPKDELSHSVEVFCSLHDLINALLGEDDMK